MDAPAPLSVPAAAASAAALPVQHPRVAIQFCTQCKWMLRAAYYAQELISTFGTALGEVALQPATGGVFRVTIETEQSSSSSSSSSGATVLWDRTVDGGFPETKELKRRLRDVVAPGRDLGHVDRAAGGGAAGAANKGTAKNAAAAAASDSTPTAPAAKTDAVVPVCEDCK